MPAPVLIHADSIRSADMRHAVPVAVPDPFLYVEVDARRVAVVTAFEVPRINAADPAIETMPPELFGIDELLAEGTPVRQAILEVYTRACQQLGVTTAVVPPDFPLELADHLRANGVEVGVDRELFEARRRSKNASEVAGLRRAQRACEAALDVARAMLRDADASGDVLRLDGESLTCERIKIEVERVFSQHGVAAEEFIVSHGAQTAIGHEMGSGPIAPGEAVVFDLFPRDRETGVYSDMTRTYVVGEIPEEIARYHALCREALRMTTEAAKPGVNGKELMRMTCDFFAAEGFPTPLTKQPGEVLDSGFFHGLGHGVGLEVHEKPSLSRSGDDLVPGDVITLEPGLYRAGFGGVRLEDILLVTDDGAEVITQYPYDLVP
ncbi:MAG TPA: Xaa-Pro peptidase family protein [Gaiellaceae bacterium]|nr:Xaa-Pro peptidase family protein [Gaiellaceae bacterium]